MSFNSRSALCISFSFHGIILKLFFNNLFQQTGNIPGNSVLVFDVHLLKVERPQEGVETLDEKFKDNGGVTADNKLVVSDNLFCDLFC